MANAAAGTNFTNDGKDDVFGGHANRCYTFHRHAHPLRARLRKCLCCKNVFYFAGTDTKCKCTKSTVCCCVAIAANNGHARKSAALFWCNDVHDALVFVAHWENGDVEGCSVFIEHFKLTLRDGVFNRKVNVRCWNVVVGGCNGEVGAAHGAASEAQTFECLRACYFVH